MVRGVHESLSATAVLLVWIYSSAAVLLLSAEVTVLLHSPPAQTKSGRSCSKAREPLSSAAVCAFRRSSALPMTDA